MQHKVTNNGKRGGNLVGKPHETKDGRDAGGIKAVVTDANNRPVELEGGEVIINKEASKKHWRKLSEINQSAGNGVPIGPPQDPHDEDPEEYKEGGVISFNANHIPNKWILKYAEELKEKHPEVWKLGGNIFGNEAFSNLKRVAERGYWLDSEEWMYVKWRSYVARHKKDFRIAGVIAMLKWVDKVDRGWSYMKALIEKEVQKRSSKKKGFVKEAPKMREGGGVKKFTAKKQEGRIIIYLNETKYGYVFSRNEYNQTLKREQRVICLKRYSDNKVFTSRFAFQNDAMKYVNNTGELFVNLEEMRDGGEVSKGIKSEIQLEKISSGYYTGTYKGVSFKIIKSKPSKSGYQSAQSTTWWAKIDFDGKIENIFDDTKKYVLERIVEYIDNKKKTGGEVSKGIKTEMEHRHTIDEFKRENVATKDVARSIAQDHLKEDKHYYTKLSELEKHFAEGGQTDEQKAKIAKVIREFKAGKLKTSYGEKVTDEKQAIAIALSEADVSKYGDGGAIDTAMTYNELSREYYNSKQRWAVDDFPRYFTQGGVVFEKVGFKKGSGIKKGQYILGYYNKYNRGIEFFRVEGFGVFAAKGNGRYQSFAPGDVANITNNIIDKFDTQNELLKKYGLADLEGAERLESQLYDSADAISFDMIFTLYTDDTDEGNLGNYWYISDGRWARGSGAEPLSFIEYRPLIGEMQQSMGKSDDTKDAVDDAKLTDTTINRYIDEIVEEVKSGGFKGFDPEYSWQSFMTRADEEGIIVEEKDKPFAASMLFDRLIDKKMLYTEDEKLITSVDDALEQAKLTTSAKSDDANVASNTIKVGNLEVYPEISNGEKMTWYDAVKKVAELGDGWRLPTIEEFQEVLYPNMKNVSFADKKEFWSSTDDSAKDTYNYLFIFTNAFDKKGVTSLTNKHTEHRVMAVRLAKDMTSPMSQSHTSMAANISDSSKDTDSNVVKDAETGYYVGQNGVWKGRKDTKVRITKFTQANFFFFDEDLQKERSAKRKDFIKMFEPSADDKAAKKDSGATSKASQADVDNANLTDLANLRLPKGTTLFSPSFVEYYEVQRVSVGDSDTIPYYVVELRLIRNGAVVNDYRSATFFTNEFKKLSDGEIAETWDAIPDTFEKVDKDNVDVSKADDSRANDSRADDSIINLGNVISKIQGRQRQWLSVIFETAIIFDFNETRVQNRMNTRFYFVDSFEIEGNQIELDLKPVFKTTPTLDYKTGIRTSLIELYAWMFTGVAFDHASSGSLLSYGITRSDFANYKYSVQNSKADTYFGVTSQLSAGYIKTGMSTNVILTNFHYRTAVISKDAFDLDSAIKFLTKDYDASFRVTDGMDDTTAVKEIRMFYNTPDEHVYEFYKEYVKILNRAVFQLGIMKHDGTLVNSKTAVLCDIKIYLPEMSSAVSSKDAQKKESYILLGFIDNAQKEGQLSVKYVQISFEQLQKLLTSDIDSSEIIVNYSTEHVVSMRVLEIHPDSKAQASKPSSAMDRDADDIQDDADAIDDVHVTPVPQRQRQPKPKVKDDFDPKLNYDMLLRKHYNQPESFDNSTISRMLINAYVETAQSWGTMNDPQEMLNLI